MPMTAPQRGTRICPRPSRQAWDPRRACVFSRSHGKDRSTHVAMQSKNRREAEEEAVALIRQWSEPLPDLDLDGAFGAAFDRFGGARVVLLGEATHGSSEFYRTRAAITRRLIERHDFSIMAVEADWPDA